jgi:hypothetical protein
MDLFVEFFLKVPFSQAEDSKGGAAKKGKGPAKAAAGKPKGKK